MNSSDISKRIKEVANKLSPIELPENYIESGIFDSMTIMRFIMELEDEFGIDFNEHELSTQEIKTISGLSNLITNKLDLR